MNWRGWIRAIESGVDEVNVPLFATDTFNRRNQGVSTDESLDLVGQVVEDAADRGIGVSATLGVAWGCPFEGEVAPDIVEGIVERLASTGIDELALADTIGVADPWTVQTYLSAASSAAKDEPLRIPFHDTRNTGLANAYAAIEAGVNVIDASVGGIGGCPFAPAATGNIPTEDLVNMCEEMNLDTGIDIDRVMEASRIMEDFLGRRLPSHILFSGTNQQSFERHRAR